MEYIKVEKTASRGIAIAPIYQYTTPDLTADATVLKPNDIEREIALFEETKVAVIAELEALSEANPLFAAHIEIAADFTLHEGILSKMKSQNKNAQMAVSETVEEVAAMFSAIDDPYMQERVADIRDVGKRYMAILKKVTLPDLGALNSPVVVMATDLYPSDTVKIDKKFVKGIITEEGGVTSHVFIIAKNMDIPILVGVKGILSKCKSEDMVCMEAEKGDIILNPDPATKKDYEDKLATYIARKDELIKLREKKITTKEGKEIHLCANVGNSDDVEKALEYGIDGVGLFRSELLYMESSHFPKEEEQFIVYKQAAQRCPGELTIRTLDIGGDKELSYFKFEPEENPFLGWRAIRISLEMEDMFKDQLRAILRASAFGHVRIMIPMIISVAELERSKKIVEECKAELKAQNIAFDEAIEVGMMIETPASVFLAEEFAQVADFFSIGTNDLTQYILAVDRGNKKVADLYDYFHPAVVHAIDHVIQSAHKHDIKVGMCGEMAGDIHATQMLFEMGLDEFSMSPSSVDYVREKLLELTK
ncbi:MAG: phosphoenolpyruvate--protein phosphotransferase [Eubacteriales bacterium]